MTPSFAARLEVYGRRVAAVADGREVTYEELAAQADEAAAALGGGRKLVLVGVRNDLPSLLAYLGALRAGHAVVPADAGNQAHLDRLTATYDPDAVVVDGRVDLRHATSAHDLHPSLALVLSTSGSTGSAKLVRLSARNLDANAEAIAGYLGLGDDDRAITSLPMHYCYGLSVVHSHLAAGAGLVLTDLSVVDRCFWDAFRAHGATSFAGVPYTFDLLDRVGFDAMTLPRLRHVTQAGGRLAPDRVRRYAELARRDGWRFFVMYGQTEATARMAYLPPERALTDPDCIGVPVPGGSFELAHDGELVYRGPNVMLGYAHGPADLALGATLDALHTGDLATRTPDGLYRIVGRRSRFVKLFGLRVDLDELERVADEAGLDAVCAGDDRGVVVAGSRAACALVREHVGLPPSAIHWLAWEDVPRLPNGKPDYMAMRAVLAGATAPAAAPAPAVAPAAQPDVAAVYARVLGVDDVRPDDTFVGLGGDSLSYVETSVALEAALGHLPPEWPTTPVGVLTARAAAAPSPSAARRRRAVPRLEANVVVRAVAVVLIVAGHADLWELPGGAHALVAVAGLNFARFPLVTGRVLRSAARVAIPSAAWIAVMAATRDDFGLAHVLLVNSVVGPPGSRHAFWFVETLVHLLLFLAALLAVPAVRRLERARPAVFAAAVVAVGLVVQFDVLGLPELSRETARPHELLWLFGVGWAAALVRSVPARAALSVAAAVGVHGFFGDPGREAVVLAAVLLVVWVRSVPVPASLARPLAAVAGASLHVYLTQWAVYPTLQEAFSPAVATVGSVALGVAAAAGAAALRPAAARATGLLRRRAPGRVVFRGAGRPFPVLLGADR